MPQRSQCWKARREISNGHSVRAYDRERPIENCQAHHLSPGNVRTVGLPARSKEECARAVRLAGLFPLAREHIHKFIGLRTDMRGNSDASVKLAKHGNSSCGVIFVENHYFDARIRPRLPGLVFG